MIVLIVFLILKTGIGPKKAWNLIENKDKLKSLLKEDILVADSFARNKKLISMQEIPKQVHKLIVEEYNQTLSE